MEQLTDLEQAVLIAAIANYRLHLWGYLDEDQRAAVMRVLNKLAKVDACLFYGERRFDLPPNLNLPPNLEPMLPPARPDCLYCGGTGLHAGYICKCRWTADRPPNPPLGARDPDELA
jgi:hypothetical protein